MGTYYIYENSDNIDMKLIECGQQDCCSGYSFGPAVRDYYIIHYVTKGKGSYLVNGEVYNLSKGQGFLICPNELTYYEADKKSPWSYSWVCFQGRRAEYYLESGNLTKQNPVFTYDNIDDFNQIILNLISRAGLNSRMNEAEVLGELYTLLGKLIDISRTLNSNGLKGYDKDEYIKNAVQYIHTHYSSEIKVSDIASFIGLNQNYLGTVFKRYTDLSPQQYIVKLRLERAKDLMWNKELSIGDIARSVGYRDQLVFSKIFKKINGIAPKEYRKSMGTVLIPEYVQEEEGTITRI